MYKGSSFSTSPQQLLFSEFLVFVIANQWVSLCGFEFHFPNWASFCVPVVYLCIFFGKTSIHVMFPFKSFCCWRVLYIFWLLIPYPTYGLQIFSSILFVLKMKEESEKAGLKLNIHKMKIMASSLITSWQIDGETRETEILYFLSLQNHCR